jgi:phenylacetate-CoA ligase
VTATVLRYYHVLPPAVRALAATVRGGYLRAWRYGPETQQLLDAALERDRWDPERWQRWEEERLAFVLHRAATRVPYYRDQWAARRRYGDRASWELLENWPILEKEPLRQDPQSFLADDRQRFRMFHEHTSGTTGTSIDLWFGRETLRAWYALYEARCRHWYGVSRHHRWAILGGQLVCPVRQDRPPFAVWNAALRQLYMSAYHIAPRNVGWYAEALRAHRIAYVLAYPSALCALARELLVQGIQVQGLIVVAVNAEPLYGYQRETIERAFGCPVRETYGMAEIVAAASECESGRLHLWPEAGHLEVIDEKRAARPEESGEFICTSLLNTDMPLVRYRVGDRGAKRAEAKCPCGRRLPQLSFVEGRTDDVLYTADGRSVGRLDPVFKSRLHIREAQIVQDSVDRLRVRYVAASGFRSVDGHAIVEGLRARMGAVTVTLEEVDSIPREANGKFRAVICNLTADERRSVRAT